MLRDVPSLGIGLVWRPGLDAFVAGQSPAPRYLRIAPGLRGVTARSAAGACGPPARIPPCVARGAGQALLAPAPLRHHYVARMRRWHEARDFAWFSEPVNLAVASRGASPGHGDPLQRLAARVRKVHATVPVPFAVDNLAPGRSAEQMNRLARSTGCRLVLDLERLARDAREEGRDAVDILARLDLERVVEVVVASAAGRRARGGLPEVHLELLRFALLSCPNLGGVTLDPGPAPRSAAAAIDTLHGLWHRYQPLPSRLAS